MENNNQPKTLKEFPQGKENYCPRCYFEDNKIILRIECPHNSAPKMENQTDFNKIFVMLLNGQCDDPNLLSKYLIQLTAHSYNLDKNRMEAERVYSQKFNEIRPQHKSDKQCINALAGSPEWDKFEEAKASYRLAKELLMSVKKRLNTLSDMARNNY